MANTLSLLVRQQLPEFIRSDYDTFVTFIEAYYAWMDQTGNTIDLAKNMPSYIDLDTTLTAFVTYFMKQFLPLFPPDRLSNPTFFIQHAKEFYRTKGTAKSIRLLFRLLYGQDIDIFYPKDSVLRASTSGWINIPTLRLDPTMWTIQYGDGITTRFRALDTSIGVTPTVYFNGVLQPSGYNHSPNEPWIIFTVAPTAGVEIKVTYVGEELTDLFNTNRIVVKLIGQTSGASVITETLQQVIVDTITQLDMQISSPRGKFTQYEVVKGNWVYDIATGDSINIYGRLVSYLSDIIITDGGLSYNVGDTVVITGGSPANAATAIVDSIFSALISNITIVTGGAGYQPGQTTHISSTPNTGLNVFVSSVNTSGIIHPNSYPINQDVISLWGNTVMSDPNFYFTPGVSENVNTLMSIAFTDFIVGKHPIERLGPITGVTITSSTAVFNPAPTLVVDPLIIYVTGNTANGNVATANVPIDYFGIMGKLNVQFGGSGYQVGDEVSFENIPGVGIGIGGAAEVTDIHAANSGIKRIEFRPSRLTGTVTVNTAVSNTQVVGVGTFFTTELLVNDRIEINSKSTYVSTIINATHLTVNTAFTHNSTNRALGIYGRYFIGGMNYRAEAMPIVHVTSGNPVATGANVVVELLLTSGASFLLEPQTKEPVGKIRTIKITNHGYGYQSPPVINLMGSGNGKANAVAVMLSNLFTIPGRFRTTEGFLSSDQKLQSDGYFTTFSYVLRSQTALNTYKSILKDLAHPAGMRLWGEYMIEENVSRSPISMASLPEELLLDTIVDNFNRADEGNGMVTGWINNDFGYPNTWILQTNTLQTANNGFFTSKEVMIWDSDLGTTDQQVSMLIKGLSTDTGQDGFFALISGIDGSGNFNGVDHVELRIQNTLVDSQWGLFSYGSMGGITEINYLLTGRPVQVGDRVTLDNRGDVYNLYLNQILVVSVPLTFGQVVAKGNYCGVYGQVFPNSPSSLPWILDDFIAGPAQSI